jgi:hypothetical protein
VTSRAGAITATADPGDWVDDLLPKSKQQAKVAQEVEKA